MCVSLRARALEPVCWRAPYLRVQAFSVCGCVCRNVCVCVYVSARVCVCVCVFFGISQWTGLSFIWMIPGPLLAGSRQRALPLLTEPGTNTRMEGKNILFILGISRNMQRAACVCVCTHALPSEIERIER